MTENEKNKKILEMIMKDKKKIKRPLRVRFVRFLVRCLFTKDQRSGIYDSLSGQSRRNLSSMGETLNELGHIQSNLCKYFWVKDDEFRN